MLADKRILEEIANGNIVIDPFDERCLGTNSYDCRLGEWYFSQEATPLDTWQDLALFSENMRAAWGKPRYAEMRHDRLMIPIAPGDTILAHTIETIGGRNGFVAKMHTRSTVARSGIDCCKAAGLGDCGYVARYTMEISNHTYNTVWLPVGARICQFSFHYIGETIKQYKGNYGQHTWTPEDMLPSAKGDWAVEEYQASLQEVQRAN